MPLEMHFLRPEWFFAIIPLALLVWLLLRRKHRQHSWQAVCDPALLPHVLIGKHGHKNNASIYTMAIAGLICIVALAGPAWQQLEQPVFREQSALVIALDLSRSMDAADIKPSRLARARHKISDILQRRSEGQTALVVYAAQAFVVSPLTHDAATIAAQLASLETALMPSQGSRADFALEKAGQLLQQAGVARGHILLITDGLDMDRVESQLTQLRARGHSLSVLAVGSEDGAPIALSGGGFLKDQNGAIVIAKLDDMAMRSIALQGGGRYSRLQTNDQDIEQLLAFIDGGPGDVDLMETDLRTDRWREEGPWLLLLVLPLAALAFRRGYIAALIIFFLPLPQPAEAMDLANLWSSRDQQAAQAFSSGNVEQAAALFENPEWRAAAHYRAGQYQQSIDALADINNADALYNKGNALARLGRFPEAIQSYDEALKRDPAHEDARYNRDLLQQKMSGEQDKSQQDSSQQNGNESNDQAGDQSGDQASSSNNQDSAEGDGSDPGDKTDQQQRQGQTQDQTQAQHDEAEQTQENSSQAAQQDEADEHQQQPGSATQQADTEQEQQQLQASEMMTEEEMEMESAQANELWLRRIPDDPGGLLRRKFKYQYQRQGRSDGETQQW